MSIFGTIIKDVKSFAAKVEAEFKKLFNEAPQWATIASGVLTYAGPVVSTIATLIAGAPAGSAVTAILADIKTDLATASAAAKSASAATTLPTLLASLQTSLPALLAAAKVENLTTVNEIEDAVNLLVPEIDALVASIPTATPAAA